jgi:hypothetical protein
MCTQQRSRYTLGRALDGIGIRLIAGAVLFLWFGWWTRQFWVSLALALGLVSLLSWGYHVSRIHRRRDTEDPSALSCAIRIMPGEKLGELVEDVFGNLPDFSDLTRRDSGIKANYKGHTVWIGWDQPENGRFTSLGQWAAFVKAIKEQKADRGILISGGEFDRECRLAAQTCGAPRVELIDHRALARLASASGYTPPISQQPAREREQNPGWFARMFYVLVRPGRCIFYAAILLFMARFFRVYSWYYFIAAGLLLAAAAMGIYMRIRNRRRWDPLLPDENRRYDTSIYRPGGS